MHSTMKAAALAGLVALAAAHPSSLTCMSEADNRIKAGAIIMGKTVVTDVTTLSLKSDSTSYKPGVPVTLTISQVPTGAFWALRASNQLGNFTKLDTDVAYTTGCPSQIITPDGPPPPASATVQWTAPPGTTAPAVTFSIAWAFGTVPSGSFDGYVKTTDVALPLASPRPLKKQE